MVGSCDRCNKHSDAMKFGEFLDHQSELLLLSKDSAPWVQLDVNVIGLDQDEFLLWTRYWTFGFNNSEFLHQLSNSTVQVMTYNTPYASGDLHSLKKTLENAVTLSSQRV